MALDTFENIKLSIVEWAHRDDIDLLVEDFITLTETEMFANEQDPLVTRGQETNTILVASTSVRTLALPARYMSMRALRITLSNGTHDITYKTPEQLPITPITGLPNYFTIQGDIEFEKVPGEAYNVECQHIAKLVPLSDAAPTNEILTNFPNIYLFGGVWAAMKWARDTEEELKYYAKFLAAIKGANKQNRKGRYGPSPRPRIVGPTP